MIGDYIWDFRKQDCKNYDFRIPCQNFSFLIIYFYSKAIYDFYGKKQINGWSVYWAMIIIMNWEILLCLLNAKNCGRCFFRLEIRVFLLFIYLLMDFFFVFLLMKFCSQSLRLLGWDLFPSKSYSSVSFYRISSMS